MLKIDQTLLITGFASVLVFGAEVCSVLVATYLVNRKVKSIINNQQFHLRKLIYDTSNVKTKQNSDLLSIEFSVNSSFENESKKRTSEKQSLLKSFGIIGGNHMSNYNGTIGAFQLSMIQILSNESAFMIYAKFLLYELSLENMMFFIEIVQYKQCIYNKCIQGHYNNGKKTDLSMIDETYHGRHNIINGDEKSQSKHTTHDKDLFLLIHFCDTIPLSLIVEHMTNGSNIDYEYNIMVAARELYYKYVSEHAEMQINLSYTTRRELDNIFHTKNDGRVLNRIYLEKNSKNHLDALLSLFDGCVSEVSSLMMDSYQRIETSSHYKKLKNALAQ